MKRIMSLQNHKINMSHIWVLRWLFIFKYLENILFRKLKKVIKFLSQPKKVLYYIIM
jgi:hypothetical protein